jgi:hypothetical protein
MGAVSYARAALQDAYEQVEVIYADNPNAKAARSKFVPESRKDFKGEPYERAMVGYYLGLTDMMSGDFENARASFRWGEFQDTMSASEIYQSDMALLNYLVGWTYWCQSSPGNAQEYFDRSREIRQSLTPPSEGDNALLLVEAGMGPLKYRTGQYGEELRYRRADSPGATSVEAEVGSKSATLALAEDLYFQATTLGGREVDKILAGKASFKETAEGVAEAGAIIALAGLNMSSQMYAYNSDMGDAAGAMAAAGALISLVSKVAAKSTKPEADIRYWDSLPESIFVATTKLDSETLPIHVTFSNGESSTSRDAEVHRTDGCYLVMAREFSQARQVQEENVVAIPVGNSQNMQIPRRSEQVSELGTSAATRTWPVATF